jgi:hypothetical protein
MDRDCAGSVQPSGTDTNPGQMTRRAYEVPAVETARVTLPVLLDSLCLGDATPACDSVATPLE